MPYFSIIIPMYNRERFISRAINSCLKQDFDDFEIIVVDDGSTDNSIKVVQEFTDLRITLICHNVNCGVGPARNTGVESATGEWVICLDSDDELTLDALSVIYKRTKQVSNKIQRVNFMCRLDSGLLSPEPPYVGEIQDFRGYIQWMERTFYGRSESYKCVRRSTFDTIRYPDDRGYEALYNLPFAEHFLQMCFPDVCRLYHQDADYQLVRPDAKWALMVAEDNAHNLEIVLNRYGLELSKWAPKVYENRISGMATLQFLAGKRKKGFQYAMKSMCKNPLNFKNLAVVILGMIDARILAWAKTINH